jgi:hypothetical protein
MNTNTWTTLTTQNNERGMEMITRKREMIVSIRAQIPGPSSQAGKSGLQETVYSKK